MALLPPPDIGAAYVDEENRPSKDFYNWIKSLYDYTRSLTGGGGGGGGTPGGAVGNVQYNAGAGNFGGYTNTQVTALLDQFTSSLKGVVPASGGGTANFLRADGTFSVPPGTGGGGAGDPDIVYVRNAPYSASVNGVTDDTAAIQAAITAAAASGKMVMLGAGTSIITTLSIPSNVILAGYGMGKSILKRANSAAAAGMLSLSTSNNVQMRDFTIDGNRTNNTTNGQAILSVTSNRLLLNRLEVTQVKTGGAIVVLNNTDTIDTRSYIQNCYIYNCDNYAISLNKSKYVSVLYCKVNDCGGGITAADFNPTFTAHSTDGIHLVGNHVNDVTEHGLVIAGSIEGYNGSGAPIYGVDNPNSSHCLVAHNHVFNADFYGIVFQADNSSMIGNTMKNCGTSGSFGAGALCNSGRCAIVGNTFEDNFEYNMDAGGSKYCTFVGNRFGGILSGNTIFNLGASVDCVATGNQIHVSGGCTGIGLAGIDGATATDPFPWKGSGTIIDGNRISGLNSATSLGIWSQRNYRDCRITNNFFSGLDDNRTIRAEIRNGTIRGNRKIIPSTALEIPTYTAATTTVYADDVEDAVITGSTDIQLLYSFSQNAFAGRIMDINITNGGSGYTQASPPGITISGGGGASAAATAVVSAAGAVIGVTMTNFGSGYTSTPSVSFASGAAAGTALLGTNSFDGRVFHATFDSVPPPGLSGGNFLGMKTLFRGGEILLSHSSNQWSDLSRSKEYFATAPSATDNGSNTGGTAVCDELGAIILTSSASGVTANNNYTLIVSNALVAVGDDVIVTIDNENNTSGIAVLTRVSVAAGSFTVRIRNIDFVGGTSFNNNFRVTFRVSKK